MIKKETIIKTGVCYWSEDDDCFVVESPLFTKTAGIGETPKEARSHFKQMVEIAYEDLKTNKIAGLNKAGRPAKHGQQLACMIQPDSYETIKSIAADLEISQGEVIDYLAFFYSVRSDEQLETPKLSEVLKYLKSIEKRMIPISAVFEQPAEYDPSTKRQNTKNKPAKKSGRKSS